MVAQGTPCLGPVTHAGCGAICPAYGRGCYGCYGPMETPNTAALAARMAGSGRRPARPSTGPSAPSTPAAEPFRKESEAHGDENHPGRLPGPRRRRGRAGARHPRRRGRRRAAAIFEPPRFFEALLRGATCTEAPDITARICGICPVAYQMSAVHAMEDALGVTVDGPLRALRRLIYCGEWIESHALHVVHAARAGFPRLSRRHRAWRGTHGEAVRRGLALKKAGNELLRLLGGREIHPVNVRVGGFYRVPSQAELAALVPRPRSAPAQHGAGTSLGRRLPVPGVRARLRVRRPAPSRRIPVERGPHRLQPRPRHRRRRVRRPCSRNATSPIRPRCNRCCVSGGELPGRAAGPLHAEPRPSARPGAGAGREAGLGPDLHATRSAASSCAPSRWSTPATKRCA